MRYVFQEIEDQYPKKEVSGISSAFSEEIDDIIKINGSLGTAEKGILLSNARVQGVDEVRFYLRICKDGFSGVKSPDRETIQIILASVTGYSTNGNNGHHQGLSLGSILLRNEAVKERLLGSNNPKKAYEVLVDAYKNLKNSYNLINNSES